MVQLYVSNFIMLILNCLLWVKIMQKNLVGKILCL